MDTTLALFDFSATKGFDLNYNNTTLPDCERIVKKMEEASSQGNLLALAYCFGELQAIPGAECFTKGPDNSLLFAIDNKQESSIEFLLQMGVSVTTTDVKAATLAKDTYVLDLFLKHGWNINKQIDSSTPSLLALVVEDAPLAAWCLSKGADPNANCALDLTPLSVAVQFAPFSVIKMLFEYGGSIKSGQLLHYAVRRDLPDYLQVLDFILSKDPPINNVMYQEHMDSYLQPRAFALGTPLHEAAEKGKLDVVRVLIEHGAQPLIKDSRGETPQQRAARARCYSVLAYLDLVATRTSWPSRQFTDNLCTNGWN